MTTSTAGNADPRQKDLRHLPSADQAWLAALAGLAQNPSTQSTHLPDGESAMTHTQAVQLRQYFLQRDALDAAAPLPADSEARMLARMHRMGAFGAQDRSAVHSNIAQPSLGNRLAAVLDWLLPSGPGAGPRYAFVAGVALAVMVVPVFIHQSPIQQDDGLRSTSRMVPQVNSGVQLMLVPQPALQVQQLQAVLQPLGVQVQVQSQGQGFQVRVSVPPAQQAAAQQAIQAWGLALNAQGELMVSVQPTGQP